jgi:hypothetical protein
MCLCSAIQRLLNHVGSGRGRFDAGRSDDALEAFQYRGSLIQRPVSEEIGRDGSLDPNHGVTSPIHDPPAAREVSAKYTMTGVELRLSYAIPGCMVICRLTCSRVHRAVSTVRWPYSRLILVSRTRTVTQSFRKSAANSPLGKASAKSLAARVSNVDPYRQGP